MSKEYYKYLAERMIQYFSETEILAGKKFIFPQESETDTKAVQEQLMELAAEQKICQPFEYICEGGERYRTFMIVKDNCSILVASQKRRATTLGFMTTLRNLVGKGEHKRFAILMLCYEQLDSLTDGTERIDGEGMPLFYKAVGKDLKMRVERSALSAEDKSVLLWHLKNKEKYINRDSLYEYKEAISLMGKVELEREDFHALRLFYDGELYEANLTEKLIDERIADNGKTYDMIETAMRRGNLDEALVNQFRDSFIHELERKRGEATEEFSWDQELEYRNIKQEKSKKDQSDADLEIVDSDIKVYQKEENITELSCYIRSSGESKIKRRHKHILIFMPRQGGQIEIQVKCNKDITIDKEKQPKEENVKGMERRRNLYLAVNDLSNPFGKGHYVLTSGETLSISFCILQVEAECLWGISKLFLLDMFGEKNKKRWGIFITGGENEILFQKNRVPEESIEIAEGLEIRLESEKGLQVHLQESEFDESGHISVKLLLENQEIPLIFNGDKEKANKISALMVEKRKLYEKKSFSYQDKKLSIGESTYYATEEFRGNLEIEEQMKNNPEEWLGDRYIPNEVVKAYQAFLDEMRRMHALPSLIYLGEREEYKQAAQECVRTVMECLQSAEQGKPLADSVRSCLNLGVRKAVDTKVLVMTAFHPLNLAYRLALLEEVVEGEIRDDIIKKLTPVNLIPYITDEEGQLYRVWEQYDTPEWIYYRRLGDQLGNGKRYFVSGVVKEKIKEYESHFAYLFPSNENVIRINAVNMGNCYELLMGLMKYYGEKTEEDIENEGYRKIEVRVYQTGKSNNYLEAFSSKQVRQEFLEKVEEEKIFRNMELNDIWNRVQRKVRYFRKDIETPEFDYAHLTFYEMETDGKKGYGRMEDIKSSVMLGGLESGISSQQYGKSYRNGFGTKNAVPETELVKLAIIYNALNVVNGTSNPFEEGNCITTELGRNDRENIEKAYDSSGWVTFIDPKVDLNFFKEEEGNKDVIIVHYDDQYTSTSGYDAITVTRKTAQYRKVLEEYLGSYSITDAFQYIPRLIDMFNAINGNWLLKLVSSKNVNFTKEKISMLSAVKLALAYLYSKDIYWIPVSMEEILRVSSAIGLSKNKGLFSAKNLGYQNIGQACDDLLMIGILLDPDSVKVFLHPIEVKIGVPQDTKAGQQLNSTIRILKENLQYSDDKKTLEKKVYRNFLMQLAIISAEKMDLYEVWHGYDWKKILETSIRENLLNDQFEISLELEEYLGEGTVIAFKKGIYTRNIQQKENLYQLNFLFQDGVNFMLKEVDGIIHLLNTSTINVDMLLKNQFRSAVEALVPVKEGTSLQERSMEILLGTDEIIGKEVYWHPNDTTKIMHINTGIIGTMGTGKTQFTKSLITQITKEQKHNVDGSPIGILIFDYKGDYNLKKQDFVDAVNPKIYGLYHLPYNPFSLSRGDELIPLLPTRVADTFKDTLAKAYGLGVKQASLLSDLVEEAYIQKGILSSDPDTWSKQAPTFEDVYRIYMEKEEIKKDDSLYSALSTLHKYQIFEPDVNKTKSLFELIEGVMVVDLSSENETIQNLIVAITLDLFYSQMQASGHSKIKGILRQVNKMILVDEADNLLRVGFSSLRKILKEGREFGVGMILSTQFLKHFNTEDEDYSSYIWTWVVHAVADFSAKDVKNIFALDDKNDIDALCGEIRRLNKHCSFVKMEQGKRPIKIQDKPFWQLE